MATYSNLVSGDSHIYEPFDLWQKALGPRFGVALCSMRYGKAGVQRWSTMGMKSRFVLSAALVLEPLMILSGMGWLSPLRSRKTSMLSSTGRLGIGCSHPFQCL